MDERLGDIYQKAEEHQRIVGLLSDPKTVKVGAETLLGRPITGDDLSVSDVISHPGMSGYSRFSVIDLQRAREQAQAGELG